MPDFDARRLEEALAAIKPEFDVAFETLTVDAQALQVLAINNMPAHLDKLLRVHAICEPLRDLPLWAKIWPASLVLGRFLRKFEPEGKTMLEIGAGMGACSLIAARHGFSRITATDMNADALNFARANIIRNGLEGIVSVRHLDITKPGNKGAAYDIIAASEISYLDDLHRPALKFVERSLAPGGRAFFCAELCRAKPRFKKLAEKSFRVTEGHIGVKSGDAEGGEERRVYNMLVLERK